MIPLRTEGDLAMVREHLRARGGPRLALAGSLLALQVLECGGGSLQAGEGEVRITASGPWTPDLQAVRRLCPDVEEPEPGTVIVRGDPAASVRAQILDELRRFEETETLRADLALRTEEADRLARELDDTNVGIMALHRDLDEAWREMQRQNDELREARTEALEASRLKSEFLASMSHDIRTPLNGVMGMAWLLLGTDLSEEQREYTRTIRTSAETLLSLVNDILDLSKIESGRIELESVPFDLLRLIEDILDVVGPGCHAKGLELMLDFSASTPRHLVGDPTRIRQILLNLLSNAIKFTQDGYVLLRVRSEESSDDEARLGLEVLDTGIGIPESALASIFDKFTQADASTTRRYGGSGLGLAICKRLTELMRGRLGVESEVDRGSRFWLELPFPPDPERPEEAPLTAPDLSVLVVDDMALRRDLLLDLLRGRGLEAEGAATAAEARERLPGFSLALIHSGLDPVGLSQAARGARTVPVLLARDAAEARLLRVDGHLHVVASPVKPTQLVPLLRHAWSGERSAAEVAPAPAGSPLDLRILLAEDNPVNRRVAVRTLEKMGCRVEVAVDGKQALEMLLRERSYDVALMDCHMPELDGFDVAREARRQGLQLRIIALTALATEEDRMRCFDAGMDDYLVKPVSPDSLRQALLAAKSA